MPSSANRLRPRLPVAAALVRPADFPHPYDPPGLLPHTLAHTVTSVLEPSGSVKQRGGGVRCGVEQRGAARCGRVEARFEFMTGGPVPPPARWGQTGSDGFATQNATARARHRAYRRRPVLGTVLSWGRRVVADCGDVYKNS